MSANKYNALGNIKNQNKSKVIPIGAKVIYRVEAFNLHWSQKPVPHADQLPAPESSSNWELQERPSTAPDPSCIHQTDEKVDLMEQRELNIRFVASVSQSDK
jgi:hypothetical protein